MSLPSWERGLKSIYPSQFTIYTMVAPLVGAWIEIYHGLHYCSTRAIVAPLVGAWIEIKRAGRMFICTGSRSPRGSVD